MRGLWAHGSPGLGTTVTERDRDKMLRRRDNEDLVHDRGEERTTPNKPRDEEDEKERDRKTLKNAVCLGTLPHVS